ncbi:MAG: hypothetical protein IMX00_08450 [Limnochordales bacterium]|nr:hypothetical protein [Limnochordales bacterium]
MDERDWYTYGSAVPEVARSAVRYRPLIPGVAEEAPGEQNQLPRSVRRTRTRYRLSARAVVVGAAIVLGLGYAYLWLQLELTSRGFELERLESQLAEELQVNEWLGQQLEQARSLERVEKVAREQLGMVDEPVLQFVAATRR